MKNTDVFSINKARFGFAYQYKFALYSIFQKINQGTIAKAFVDYFFGNNGYSIDLVITDNTDKSFAYEIKTGETFINDRNNCFEEALKNLFTFERDNNCKLYVVIPVNKGNEESSKLPYKFLQSWTDLNFIKVNTGKNNLNETPRETANRYYNEFNFNEMYCNFVVGDGVKKSRC